MKRYVVVGLYSDGWDTIVSTDNRDKAFEIRNGLLQEGAIEGYLVVTREHWKTYLSLKEGIDQL